LKLLLFCASDLASSHLLYILYFLLYFNPLYVVEVHDAAESYE